MKVFLKTEDEIELMRRANRLVGKTLGELSKHIRPGITTLQLDKIADTFIRDHGAVPTFKNFPNPYGGPFPGSICTSVNDVVVHGVPNSSTVLKDGDIITVDCGVLLDEFNGDSAYTFCVGEIDDKVRQLLKTTYESLYLGIEKAEGTKIITCHSGNGASIAAVKDGKVVDTSMGLTPLEGLIMGTRSGDIDAGAVTFIMDKEGLDTKGISNLLNKQSGLLGVSGGCSDFRDILAAIESGNDQARLAKDMYCYRIKKYIGEYAAAMGGVDVIVFTGGAGENQWEVREGATAGLEFLGVKMSVEKNHACRAVEATITADDSPVKVCVIPTDEELMIATDTLALVQK